MSVRYTIHAIQVDRPDWLSDLRRAVASELRALGIHRSIAVDVLETPPPTRGMEPVVSVALVGPVARLDDGVSRAVAAVLADGRVVIPVVEDLASFRKEVPALLSPFNGFEWSGVEPERRLAQLLLEELDIEDRERRVFLSHKRADGLGAAEQLHDALTRYRFAPFIDRLALPAGCDVQSSIAEALERYAFLLVLETPEANTSDWVYDEVDYALSHTMGVLIVQWPGDVSAVPGTVGVPRFKLTPADIVKDAHGYDTLSATALERLLPEVERLHAQGIVRRRRMLIGSVADAVRNGGGTYIPLRRWSLDVSSATGRSVVTVAARLPDARDLQELDEIREEVDPTADAILVHATRRLGDAARRHLTWVTGTRNLVMLPDNAIGARW